MCEWVGDCVCVCVWQVEVVAALVHQYDRVDVLVKQVEGLYALEGEVFQTFQQRYSIKRES
jgi:hypothetical protein